MALSLYIYTGENDNITLFTADDRRREYVKITEIIEDYFIENWDRVGQTDYSSLFIPAMRGVFLHGVFMNNFLYKIGKRNVLFVTNHNDSDWDSYTIQHKDVTNPNSLKANIGYSWTPIVDQFMNGKCVVNFTSAFKPGDMNVVKYVHGRYGVPSTNCNEKYELGMTNWTIDMPTEKYDTVILAAIPNPSGQVHNIEDIKATFAPYCTDDFILIDEFESDESRLEVAKLWPDNDPDELKRIGSERPQRIEGDKLNFVDKHRSINTYSLFSDGLDEAITSFNRNSDILFEYFLDIY